MRGKAMKAATTACMPRLARGGCRASTARPAGSVSLLERIRDVVLRLIMLTAVSKASVQRSGSGSGSSRSSKASFPRSGGRGREPVVAVTCRRDDSIRNEAVEECIEFLKRSSAEGDAVKLSSVTADTVAVAVPVKDDPSKRLPNVAVAPEPETQTATVVAGVEAVGRSTSPAGRLI